MSKYVSDWNDIDQDDYRLKPPFIAYCARVRSVLSKTGITVGEIKRRLGDDLNDNWLGEALDSLKMDGKASVTECAQYDIWSWAESKLDKKGKTVPWQEGNGYLFSKGGRPASETPQSEVLYGEKLKFG